MEGARRLPKREAVAGGPPRIVGHTLDDSMWHDFREQRPATCDLRAHKGAYDLRPANQPLRPFGHLPYEGRLNDERRGHRPQTQRKE